MKRMNSLIAGLTLAAIAVVLPTANAVVKKVVKKIAAPVAIGANVHYVGVGSSAMYNGFAVAAYNDLGPAALTACEAGGDTCTLSHWSNKRRELYDFGIGRFRNADPRRRFRTGGCRPRTLDLGHDDLRLLRHRVLGLSSEAERIRASSRPINLTITQTQSRKQRLPSGGLC